MVYIYPRRDGDTPEVSSVWRLIKELSDEKYTPTNEELEILKGKLNKALDKLL